MCKRQRLGVTAGAEVEEERWTALARLRDRAGHRGALAVGLEERYSYGPAHGDTGADGDDQEHTSAGSHKTPA